MKSEDSKHYSRKKNENIDEFLGGEEIEFCNM